MLTSATALSADLNAATKPHKQKNADSHQRLFKSIPNRM